VILLDTSVWIEIFRRPPRISMTDVADLEEIVTCLPIVQEVLQGFRDEQAFRVAREAMFALPMVESPLHAEVYDQAIELYRLARRNGFIVRSSKDCLIAACALRHGLTIVHHDRDFAALARVSVLRVRDLSL
jgi:predicted nucleic acid-binding protein